MLLHIIRGTIVLSIFFGHIHLTHASTLPPGFAELLIAQDLDPTAMALSPDGRLFVTEKSGRILIVENGQLLPDPFITLEVDNYNERGLSGIAFDPDFAQNGYIYLYYSVKGQNRNRISRFTADGNYVVQGSEIILLNLNPLSGTIHNGGSMAFGIDGKLYVSVGDGANANNAQSLNTLLGKVLRINADGSIPQDNPFYNQATGVNRAIYARGLRNSFSLAIQPGTGHIFASEVGQSTWEEINEILPGKNYGWPIIEGPLNGQTPPADYMDPVYYYHHDLGCAAVGTAFYNPIVSLFPQEYTGKFFFADYCRGYIKYIDPNQPDIVNTFATDINRPLNLLVAPDGTMYYLARAGLGGGSEQDNTASNNGTLWRVFYTGSGKPFVSVNPQSILVSVGEDARFAMAATGNDPITYQWQKNGVDIPGATSSEYIFQNVMLSDSGSLFRAIATNADGSDTTASALLRVTTNLRPLPDIITPLEGAKYRAGDTLFFSGHAFDNELGEMDSTALRWKIDFHHNVHTHPALVPTTGIFQGQYIIPTTGETSDDVWYRIYLSVTDDVGLTRTIFRDIFPVKTQFTVQTIPVGLPVYVDGDYNPAPVNVTSVVGVIRQIEAVASVVDAGSIWIFKEWTDGVTDNVRSFPASDDTITYMAVYENFPLGNGAGLKGYYYDGIPGDPTFYEPYKFTWIDETVDFDWGDGSPAPAQLGNDYWLVRWEGFVEPIFDDQYNFHLVGDDGIRLWVDNDLLIDAWIPQGPTEWTGTISLEAGNVYPVKIEFFEEAGGAVCQFSWSSDRIAKSIVPRTQLYPEISTSVDETGKDELIRILPNPAFDKIYFKTNLQSDFIVNVLSLTGEVLFTQNDLNPVDVSDWSAGLYFLEIHFQGGQNRIVNKFVKM